MSLSSSTRRWLVIAIALTDTTFVRTIVRGEACWVGRCLHCNTKLVVPESGSPDSAVTVEHIVPQTHGGDDALTNVALACARCNHEKGRRHDIKRLDDPRRVALERTLFEKRAARWREPPDGTAHLLTRPYDNALGDPLAAAETPLSPLRMPRARGRRRP